MERECLLAAFEMVQRYAANGHAPSPTQLGALVSTLTFAPAGAVPAQPPLVLPPPPAPSSALRPLSMSALVSATFL
ncbi:MAG: hypothetical protein ABI992_07720 [Chthoniobacterales bacterium]